MKKNLMLPLLLIIIVSCKTQISPDANSTSQSNEIPVSSEYIIVDHRTSSIADIPTEYIELAKDNVKVHFAGQSHSGQVLGGLQLVYSNNTAFSYDDGWYSLPSNSGELCIYSAQAGGNDFAFYTGTNNGSFSNAKSNYSAINVSIFIWCRDLDTADETFVQNYLNAMSLLENNNPGVRFVYCTGNADASGQDGARRFHNNEIIRNFVKQGNNRILFDFADLDCRQFTGGVWVQNTYTHNGEIIPVKPSSQLSEPGYNWSHATESSCLQKGKAFWYLMARLAGWDGS